MLSEVAFAVDEQNARARAEFQRGEGGFVGADTQEAHLVYQVKDQDRASLEKKLSTLQIGAKPRLVLQIGGGRRASWRDWPMERYAELLRLIAQNLSGEVFVLGGGVGAVERGENDQENKGETHGGG